VRGDEEEYRRLIENLIRFAGLEPRECYIAEQDCWQFSKGSVDIYVYMVAIGGEHYINVASPLMAAPPLRREELYERLLRENAQRIAVKFSLRDDVVWLEINRELAGLGFDELKRTLVRVAEVADELYAPLTAEFGEPAEDA